MTNRKRYYNLPDYKTVTTDVEEYLNGWRDLAAPIEKALGLQLAGFDPDFSFRCGSAHSEQSTYCTLPTWLVRKLSLTLESK